MTTPHPDLTVDVAVIGAGTAGLGAFRAASEHTDSVVLIEGGVGGTTCARVGCMPSKLLIAAAEAAHQVEKAEMFGVLGTAVVDGVAVMDRVRRERDRFVGFVHRGVESIPSEQRIQGWATFLDDHHLQVGDRVIRADRVVVATGSSPVVLPFLRGLGDRLLVNDDVFDWTDLPESVAVFGPGVIGLELGQALHRLGVRVRVFGIDGQVGPLSDPAVLDRARRAFAEELDLHLEHEVASATRDGDGVRLVVDVDGERLDERFDYVLSAVGRRPNLGGLGLENTSLCFDARGRPRIDLDTGLAVGAPIFFAGDVTGDRPLLHEASDEGRTAGANAGRFPDVRPGHRRTPLAVVFSEPQIAMVGSRFADLPEDAVIGQVSFDDQGRSRVMGVNAGLLRVYVDPRTRTLLGAESVGPRQEHLAHLLAWCHQAEMTIDQMLCMPFYHPVIEEGLRTALRDARDQLPTVLRSCA